MTDYARTPDGRPPAVTVTLTRWVNALMASAVGDLASHYCTAVLPVFKMRGMDALTTALDSWLVLGRPDFTAAGYHGSLMTPLRQVVVIDQWTTRGA